MSPRPGLVSVIAALLLWSAAGGPLVLSARPHTADGKCCSAQRDGMCDAKCGKSCCRGHTHVEASDSEDSAPAPATGSATCALRSACGGGEDGIVTIATLGAFLPEQRSDVVAPATASRTLVIDTMRPATPGADLDDPPPRS